MEEEEEEEEKDTRRNKAQTMYVDTAVNEVFDEVRGSMWRCTIAARLEEEEGEKE
eukprot:CAMPEP_0197849844 /NCGR_PEP_ID=MMETSP1438-20131217/13395_1 /TAXON_ID=1461541 /ORGANISM="Pterosperma sp., Strain CCMP1384" /LENGTH=54 /DNA_ID=CAMNT_0043462709 /DNA_START=114 /DNA_END=276 /DNA_ORIENTATION=-